jgi:hypothetical protein
MNVKMLGDFPRAFMLFYFCPVSGKFGIQSHISKRAHLFVNAASEFSASWLYLKICVSLTLQSLLFLNKISCTYYITCVLTDEKENQGKEIRNGAIAKSYMTNGLLMYD